MLKRKSFLENKIRIVRFDERAQDHDHLRDKCYQTDSDSLSLPIRFSTSNYICISKCEAPNNYVVIDGNSEYANQCLSECPKDKPILKYEKCQNIYCSPKEFETNICSIENLYAKTQWLNNIHFFDISGISNVCATSNSWGDLFLIAQSYISETGDKYIYAFDKTGNGLFYDEVNKTYYSFET